MPDVIIQKILAGTGAIITIIATYIAQSGIIQDGFDQLFSLGLLCVAVVVIWKAFSRKDESETALLREQIQIQQEHIETLTRMYEKIQDENETLTRMYEKIQDHIEKLTRMYDKLQNETEKD